MECRSSDLRDGVGIRTLGKISRLDRSASVVLPTEFRSAPRAEVNLDAGRATVVDDQSIRVARRGEMNQCIGTVKAIRVFRAMEVGLLCHL